MLEVLTYEVDQVEDRLLEFAVILSKYQGKWLLCRHKTRQTWELPGGHREAGENILAAAKRELFEETGALEFELQVICAYSVKGETERFGLFCYAEVAVLGDLPQSEIAEIQLFEEIPEKMTYPMIQPFLMTQYEAAKMGGKIGRDKAAVCERA